MADPTETPTNTQEVTLPETKASAVVPVADVQAEVKKALDAQQVAFSAQLKEVTGHDSLEAFQEAQLQQQGRTQELLDKRTNEATLYKELFQNSRIKSDILAAAADALDPDTIYQLLESTAKCDDKGTVTINAQSPVDAVKALLDAKPFLAKPEGDAGSGTPAGSGAPDVDNPFSTEHFNLTEQIRIKKENPALAEKLKSIAAAQG